MGEREDRWVELVRAGTVLFGAGFARMAHEGRWRDELRAAYHQRAMETHPDRAVALGRRPEELLRRFREVTEAYALLSAHLVAGPEVVLAGVPQASAQRAASSRPTAHHPRSAYQPPPAPRPPATPPRRPPPSASRPAPPATASARPAPRASPPRASPPMHAAPTVDAATPVRPLPVRRLRLAEFLYYSGRVSWPQFAAAVAWQRQQRPAIGRIAIELGFLDQRTVSQLLEWRRVDGVSDEPFGQYAVRRGHLTPSQLLTLLGRQQRQQRRIGEFFTETGLLLESELEAARLDLARHNARVASRAA